MPAVENGQLGLPWEDFGSHWPVMGRDLMIALLMVKVLAERILLL